VVNENNEAVMRPVVTGKWVGKDWVITEGLKAGDKVIVDNIIKLRPGTPVLPHSSDMSHASSFKQTDSGVKK
jgi:membrane fusion protein (multidrug efflux system)